MKKQKKRKKSYSILGWINKIAIVACILWLVGLIFLVPSTGQDFAYAGALLAFNLFLFQGRKKI